MVRAIVTVVSCSFVVGLSAVPASAHYVYDDDYVYESHENCTKVRAETSHGDGGGYRKVSVESSDQLNTWAGDYDCTAGRAVPAGQIAARAILWRWNSGKSRWEVCSDPGWYYNSGKADHYTIAMKPVPADKTPCGDGWYGTTGLGYVVYNSKWYGGPEWSGHHWLPA